MNIYDFREQVALVTGGTRGIGAAVTKALLKAGATVVATYAGNATAAQKFVDTLPDDQRGRLETDAFDVADTAQVEEFFQRFDQQHDRLDVTVNCAGIRQDGVVAMLPKESWQRVLDVNLGGAFHVSKQSVLRMLARRYGRIVLLTSPMGRIGWLGQANYASSKAGLVGFCKSLAKEVARRGITVNCISPGFIDTDFIGNLPPEQKQEYVKLVPMRRFGTPEEVADATLYLASRSVSYITGTVLEISGGL
ncbi:MAG: 3-oxoacyl-ACP reductase FabG [Victivallales bacterium]|nr:3-oxoacyl-ACP reductase FabG [Victivallales bacterium]